MMQRSLAFCLLWTGMTTSLLDESYTTAKQDSIAVDGSWMSHKGKKYLFVMDAARRQDLNYNDAKRRCFELGSALVTVDTEEEFDFLKDEIRRRVILSGQEFAHEQWWTAGRVSGNSWVWERPNKPSVLVTVSALKRRHVPKKGVHYLAISHGYEQQGWRLRSVPESYRLRYVCQKEGAHQPPGSSHFSEDVLWNILNPNSREQASTTNSDTSHVILQMQTLRFISLDEATQTLCTRNAFTLEWNNSRMQWDSLDFSNTTYLHIAADVIWTPTLVLLNGAAKHRLDELATAQALVTSSGRVQVKAVEDLCTTCSGDTTYFPFDRFHCPIEMGTATAGIVLRVSQTDALPNDLPRNSGVWTVEGRRQTATPCYLSESYFIDGLNASLSSSSSSSSSSSLPVCARFDVIFRRQLFYYVAVLLFPMALLTIPLLVLLLVSPGHRIKVPALLISTVIYWMMAQFICHVVTRRSAQVPILILYPLNLLGICVTSVCISLAFIRSPSSSSSSSSSSSVDTQHLRCSCCSAPSSPSPKNKCTANANAATASPSSGAGLRCSCDSIPVNDDTSGRYQSPSRSLPIRRPSKSTVAGDHRATPKSTQPLFDLSSDDERRSINPGSGQRKRSATLPSFGHTVDFSDPELGITDAAAKGGCTTGEHAKRHPRRNLWMTERKLDMAMFVLVTLQLNGYVIAIIMLSF